MTTPNVVCIVGGLLLTIMFTWRMARYRDERGKVSSRYVLTVIVGIVAAVFGVLAVVAAVFNWCSRSSRAAWARPGLA